MRGIDQFEDRHLKDAVADGDTTHLEAAEAMKGRCRNPLKGWAGARPRRRPSPNSPRTDPAVAHADDSVYMRRLEPWPKRRRSESVGKPMHG